MMLSMFSGAYGLLYVFLGEISLLILYFFKKKGLFACFFLSVNILSLFWIHAPPHIDDFQRRPPVQRAVFFTFLVMSLKAQF